MKKFIRLFLVLALLLGTFISVTANETEQELHDDMQASYDMDTPDHEFESLEESASEEELIEDAVSDEGDNFTEAEDNEEVQLIY